MIRLSVDIFTFIADNLLTVTNLNGDPISMRQADNRDEKQQLGIHACPVVHIRRVILSSRSILSLISGQ